MLKILTLHVGLIILAGLTIANPHFCNAKPYDLYVSGAIGKSHILGSAQKTKFLEHDGAPILRGAIGLFHATHEKIYSRLEVEMSFVNFKNSPFIFPGVSETKNRHYKNLKVVTLIPNIYIGWHAHNIIKPYIGMGVGHAKMKHVSYVEEEGKYREFTVKSEYESNIAAQVIVGSSFKMSDKLFLTVDHRRIKHNGLPCKSYNMGIMFMF